MEEFDYYSTINKEKRKYQRMYARLQKPEVKEALEYFEAKEKEREERQKRLDFLGIEKIRKMKNKNKFSIIVMMWIIQQLGGKCKKCGYEGIALTIHHKNGRDTSINRWKEYKAWYEKQEIPDNIELLCANCHMELEWKVRENYKNI